AIEGDRETILFVQSPVWRKRQSLEGVPLSSVNEDLKLCETASTGKADSFLTAGAWRATVYICHVFHSSDEERRVILPLKRTGSLAAKRGQFELCNREATGWFVLPAALQNGPRVSRRNSATRFGRGFSAFRCRSVHRRPTHAPSRHCSNPLISCGA